jgi:tetratricopeptide (TPR) repeat protein
MGETLTARGRTDEAKERYRDALRIRPSFIEAHNNLGIILAIEGNKAEAILHFEAALRLRPDYEAAGKNLRFILNGEAKGQKPGK